MYREDTWKADNVKVGEFADLKGMWSCFCIQSKNIMCNNKGKIAWPRQDDTAVLKLLDVPSLIINTA
jgi:hypothetical protein